MSESEYKYTAKDGKCQYSANSAYRYFTRAEGSYVTVTKDDVA